MFLRIALRDVETANYIYNVLLFMYVCTIVASLPPITGLDKCRSRGINTIYILF